jgi:hypothetical protein
MFNSKGLTGDEDGSLTIAITVPSPPSRSDKQRRRQVSHQRWVSNAGNVGICSPRHLRSLTAYALPNIRLSASKRGSPTPDVPPRLIVAPPQWPARFPDVPSQPEMALGHFLTREANEHRMSRPAPRPQATGQSPPHGANVGPQTPANGCIFTQINASVRNVR